MGATGHYDMGHGDHKCQRSRGHFHGYIMRPTPCFYDFNEYCKTNTRAVHPTEESLDSPYKRRLFSCKGLIDDSNGPRNLTCCYKHRCLPISGDCWACPVADKAGAGTCVGAPLFEVLCKHDSTLCCENTGGGREHKPHLQHEVSGAQNGRSLSCVEAS